jgi:hypothetical protein
MGPQMNADKHGYGPQMNTDKHGYYKLFDLMVAVSFRLAMVLRFSKNDLRSSVFICG